MLVLNRAGFTLALGAGWELRQYTERLSGSDRRTLRGNSLIRKPVDYLVIGNFGTFLKCLARILTVPWS